MMMGCQAPVMEDPDDCLTGRRLGPGLHCLDCDYHPCYAHVESHHDHEGV